MLGHFFSTLLLFFSPADSTLPVPQGQFSGRGPLLHYLLLSSWFLFGSLAPSVQLCPLWASAPSALAAVLVSFPRMPRGVLSASDPWLSASILTSSSSLDLILATLYLLFKNDNTHMLYLITKIH